MLVGGLQPLVIPAAANLAMSPSNTDSASSVNRTEPPSGSPSIRVRNAAISPLVTYPFGQNSLLTGGLHPLVMPAAASALRGLAADAMVILDEVHHAGHERAWGDGVFTAFELAAKRLSLSGTPFRSDSSKIPFVRYDATAEGDLAHADYTYGYGDALRDGGVVRPVYFPNNPEFAEFFRGSIVCYDTC